MMYKEPRGILCSGLGGEGGKNIYTPLSVFNKNKNKLLDSEKRSMMF